MSATAAQVRLTRRGKLIAAVLLTGVLLAMLTRCVGAVSIGQAAEAAGRGADDSEQTQRRSITLAFAGDFHFEGPLADAAEEEHTIVGPMANSFASADLAAVNLESSIGGRGTAEPKQYRFNGPAKALTSLAADGIDVVSLANNHGMDFGVAGLQGTLDVLTKEVVDGHGVPS